MLKHSAAFHVFICVLSATICVVDSFLLSTSREGLALPLETSFGVGEKHVCQFRIGQKSYPAGPLKVQAALLKPLCDRRLILSLAVAITISSQAKTAISADAETKTAPYPTDDEIKAVQRAIQAFDRKNLNEAQDLFTVSINRWEELRRPR